MIFYFIFSFSLYHSFILLPSCTYVLIWRGRSVGGGGEEGAECGKEVDLSG